MKIARTVKEELFKKYEEEKKYRLGLDILDEGFKNAFTYLNNEEINTRLKSTNCLERLNEEIRIREKSFVYPQILNLPIV